MWEHLKRRSSYQALPLVESKRSSDLHKELHHPVLQSLRLVQMETQRGVSAIQTIITLNKLISPQSLHQCLRFIYTGTIDKECSNLQVILLLWPLIMSSINKVFFTSPGNKGSCRFLRTASTNHVTFQATMRHGQSKWWTKSTYLSCEFLPGIIQNVYLIKFIFTAHKGEHGKTLYRRRLLYRCNLWTRWRPNEGKD